MYGNIKTMVLDAENVHEAFGYMKGARDDHRAGRLDVKSVTIEIEYDWGENHHFTED